MNNLNLNRLWLTIRWDFTNNWQTTAKLLAMVTFVIMAVTHLTLWPLYSMHYDDMPIDQFMIRHMNVMCSTIIFLYVMMGVCIGSFTFGFIKPGKKRITFLMQPASALEKYLTRLIYTTVGYTLIFAVSLVIADVLECLILLAHGTNGVGSISLAVLKRIVSPDDDTRLLNIKTTFDMLSVAYYAGLTFFFHSMFVFYSIINSKLLRVVMSAVTIMLLLWLNVFDMPNMVYGLNLPDMVLGALCAAAFAFAAGLYTLAYKTSLRLQIVSNGIF